MMGPHFRLLPVRSSVSLWAALTLCAGVNRQSEHLFFYTEKRGC